jgi:hypothetical protein
VVSVAVFVAGPEAPVAPPAPEEPSEVAVDVEVPAPEFPPVVLFVVDALPELPEVEDPVALEEAEPVVAPVAEPVTAPVLPDVPLTEIPPEPPSVPPPVPPAPVPVPTWPEEPEPTPAPPPVAVPLFALDVGLLVVVPVLPVLESPPVEAVVFPVVVPLVDVDVESASPLVVVDFRLSALLVVFVWAGCFDAAAWS